VQPVVNDAASDAAADSQLAARDPLQRAVAAAATGFAAPSPTARTRLEQLVREDPDPRVRAAALGALFRVGSRAGVRRAWRAALDDPSATVRRRAAELTPSRAADLPVRPLVLRLADPEMTVVEAAAWALGELGPRAVPAGGVSGLARIARHHDDPLVREAAVAALGAIGHRAGLPAILAGCSDRPAVRRRAVLALAPFDGPAVDSAITRALEDRDWQVRQAAEDLTRD